MDILSCQEDVLVTGGTGMVGRALQEIMPDAHYLSTKDCDLTRYSEVERVFRQGRIPLKRGNYPQW